MNFARIFSKNFLLSFVNLVLAFWVPAFYLYSLNVGDALFLEFLFLLPILFFIALFLLLFTKKLFNSYFKSSLFFSVLYLGVFLGANIYRQVYNLDSFMSGLNFLRPAYFLLIYFFLLFLFLGFIYKKTIKKNVLKFLILVFSYLIIFYLFNIYSSYKDINKYIKIYKEQNLVFRNKFNDAFFHSNNSDKPDIYYIILDAHASIKDLKEYHNYNPNIFVKKLEYLGFIFPQNSKSNYHHTIQSLPSSLNMNYLLNINSYKNLTFALSSYLIQNSNWQHFMENLDYKFINIPSSWAATRSWQRKFSLRDLFFGDFVQNFIYSFTSRKIFYPLYAYIKKIELLEQLDYLYKQSQAKSPKALFAHFTCPHLPYVFKNDGSFEKTEKFDNQAYIDQLDFFDRQISEFLNFVIFNSEKKPIIILQSDHGSHGYGIYPKICEYFSKQDKENLKFNILSAFYLPGIDEKDLPKDISPVNNFRFIFNKYFGTDFKILKNKQIG